MGGRVSGHRMRFYRRNFKRMYPEAGEQSRRQLERHLRWRTFVGSVVRLSIAGAALAAVLAGWIWVLRR